MKKESEIIEIYDGTAWQAGIVKTLLEDAGLEAFLKDEIMGTFNPWWTAGGGAGSVKVMISGLDYDKAKDIVDKFEESQK